MTAGRRPHLAEQWDGGWDAHRRRQVEAWLATTPAQRLAWLEEAILFAHRTGALPGVDSVDLQDENRSSRTAR